MADHRWGVLDNESSSTSDKKAGRSNGVNPALFYRKRDQGDKITTASERQLESVLRLASEQEIVQMRSKYTFEQKRHRSAYNQATILKTFPLQDLAFNCFLSMMKDYAGNGDHPPQSQSAERQVQMGIISDHGRKAKKRRECLDIKSGDVQDEKHPDRPIHCNNSERQRSTKYNYLWSMEPRIFAVETSSTGKRKYIVGHLGRFLEFYWKCDPTSRHYYELIHEGKPSRLYFDLEYNKLANPQITADESEDLMTEFIHELCSEMRLTHGVQIDRSCVVDLDSSTDKKFSRHLIVHLPKGELFADARSAGVFVRRFVGRLAEEVATGVLAGSRRILAKHLFVNSQPQEEAAESPQNGMPHKKNMTCFVDLGVYTKNRLFRLMGSTKYGKSSCAALRIADANEFQFPPGFHNSKFYQNNKMSIDSIAREQSSPNETWKADSIANKHLVSHTQHTHDIYFHLYHAP